MAQIREDALWHFIIKPNKNENLRTTALERPVEKVEGILLLLSLLSLLLLLVVVVAVADAVGVLLLPLLPSMNTLKSCNYKATTLFMFSLHALLL